MLKKKYQKETNHMNHPNHMNEPYEDIKSTKMTEKEENKLNTKRRKDAKLWQEKAHHAKQWQKMKSEEQKHNQAQRKPKSNLKREDVSKLLETHNLLKFLPPENWFHEHDTPDSAQKTPLLTGEYIHSAQNKLNRQIQYGILDKDEYEFDSRFKKEGLQLTPDDIHKAIDENTASCAQRAIYSRNEKLHQDLQPSQKWKHRLRYRLGQESLLNEQRQFQDRIPPTSQERGIHFYNPEGSHKHLQQFPNNTFAFLGPRNSILLNDAGRNPQNFNFNNYDPRIRYPPLNHNDTVYVPQLQSRMATPLFNPTGVSQPEYVIARPFNSLTPAEQAQYQGTY